MEENEKDDVQTQDTQPTQSKSVSSSALIVLALIIAALIGYIVYINNSKSDVTVDAQPEVDTQVELTEEFVETTQQNVQQQKEAIAAAERELSEKEAILANGIADLENQSCENALAIAKTQKALLTKEISEIKAIGDKIANNPIFAIDVCRQLNPDLSKPECEARIALKTGEAEASIIEMEALVVELDERIAAGCTEPKEVEQVNGANTNNE